MDVSHTPKQVVRAGQAGCTSVLEAKIRNSLRMSRSAADANRLTGDLVSSGSTKKRDEVRDFFRLDHFTKRHAGHRLLLEFLNADSGRCGYVAHAGPSHLRIRPAGAKRIHGNFARRELECQRACEADQSGLRCTVS